MTAPTWLTGKADAASLPALLEGLAPRLDIATIDELYVFPTRRVQGVESTVFVFSVHDAEDRRRVITAHLRATRNKRGEPAIETRLDEHATTLPERVPRVIEGVLKRLSEDFAATPPSHALIDRSEVRWHALIEQLTGIPKGQALPEELIAKEDAANSSTANETVTEDNFVENPDAESQYPGQPGDIVEDAGIIEDAGAASPHPHHPPIAE